MERQNSNLGVAPQAVATESHLFSPLTIRELTLRNRIGVSPMCQYNSVDGFAKDWHLVHLGSRAVGGAALVICEATAVEPIGRITPDDLGIYYDEHIPMLRKITDFLKEYGAVPGIQLAHAGRKASALSPWKADQRHEKVTLTTEDGGWDIVGPSAEPFSANSKVPKELTIEQIQEIQQKFVDAAARALNAGFQWLELHSAHGYLLHSFYSPLSNHRNDLYGGSFENRIRFVVETATKLRQVWPQKYPFSVRISASDWVEDGWTVEDSVQLAKILAAAGVDVIDCSSGNVRAGDRYKMEPGWQVPLSERVRAGAGVMTAAVGMITQPGQADDIIRSGKADLVFLARQMMRDPHWPLRAATELGLPPSTVLPRIYSYAI